MGYQLNVFLLDEPARHDSSAVIEMLSITIENVSRAYQVLFWVWFGNLSWICSPLESFALHGASAR